jgi:integrase
VPAAAFATQLRSVTLLESLGLVERAPATSPMRTAILHLLERDCTQPELGQQATASLRARGFIEAVPLADARLRASAEQVALTRATLALVCAEVPTVKVERSPQRLTRLAVATGDGDPHADADRLSDYITALDRHADGDALDRILWLSQAFALRPREARGLKVGDLDLTQGRIAIRRNRLDDDRARTLKTRHSERQLELMPAEIQRLTAWTAGRDATEWLVTGTITTRGLNARRNLRARQVGFTGRLYDSDHRHIRATLALRNGATLTQTAAMLGHKNTVQVSKTYGELTKGVVSSALRVG